MRQVKYTVMVCAAVTMAGMVFALIAGVSHPTPVTYVVATGVGLVTGALTAAAVQCVPVE